MTIATFVPTATRIVFEDDRTSNGGSNVQECCIAKIETVTFRRHSNAARDATKSALHGGQSEGEDITDKLENYCSFHKNNILVAHSSLVNYYTFALAS